MYSMLAFILKKAMCVCLVSSCPAPQMKDKTNKKHFIFKLLPIGGVRKQDGSDRDKSCFFQTCLFVYLTMEPPSVFYNIIK